MMPDPPKGRWNFGEVLPCPIQPTVRQRGFLASLRSPAARRIDFILGKWHINASAFESVAKAIELGDIDVVVGTPSTDPAVEAVYNHKRDFVNVPNASYGAHLTEQAGIIHECVHAFVDIQNISGQTESANEAAAYVAMMLYILHTGNRIPPSNVGIAEIATPIAEYMKDHPGAAVPSIFESDLRWIIAMSPVYRSKGMTTSSPDRSDGVWRFRGRTDLNRTKRLPPGTRLA
jgi:hypothetical protein